MTHVRWRATARKTHDVGGKTRRSQCHYHQWPRDRCPSPVQRGWTQCRLSSMLFVTVIVVGYRSASLICDLLMSINRQGAGWVGRVIVVDNASGDCSLEALEAMVVSLGMSSIVEVIDAGKNGGFGAGNNAGAAAAMRTGNPDVLWFLNPDTLVDGVHLEQALEWFEREPRVGIVGTGLDDGNGGHELAGHHDPTPLGEFVRNGGAFVMLRRYLLSDPRLDRPGPVEWVSGASLMIRSSTFEQLGGFDESFFLYFEEVDLCRRARRSDWAVVYEPRVRVVHFEGQTTGTKNTKPHPRCWYESRRRYFVKHFGKLGLLCADAAWLLGRAVAKVRLKDCDSCRWGELWQ
ncbi:MAG: glycosyltransferase, partial [Planctomycetota bacterium]|nr:glycosyltransferase [Planctomycetota bacterium]